ncbi:hypothetical protein [Salinibius halmophilus]|uniref:hypothetical protein n=1 Tax=Salinibius halmophilus TaxID=1853216 RepID=UPI000E669A71|nr:hypothetical protein [Salinibius halmophilus]
MLNTLLMLEWRKVRTDAFLILLATMSPLLAVLLRIYWPVLNQNFPNWQLNQYASMASVLLATITPMMMGFILGFQLLLEREANLLAAISVTRLGLRRYILLRVAVYSAIGFLLTVVIHQLLGLVVLPLWQVVCIALLSLPLLGLSLLLLMRLAKNLVEGFAAMKALGFLISVPIIVVLFVPVPWYWLAGILPTFWSIAGYHAIAAGEQAGWWMMLFGAVYQMIVCGLLWLRLLNRK